MISPDAIANRSVSRRRPVPRVICRLPEIEENQPFHD
jgi:hypothetical protein